jgi:hypothetical protein
LTVVKLHELNIAIAQATRLPKPQAATPKTVRRNGEVLPKGVYRGYKGQFIAMVRENGRTKYLGTFRKVETAEAAVTSSLTIGSHTTHERFPLPACS